MQDRVFVTDNAVILLDGATDPDATERDGGWIADRLGKHLADALIKTPDLNLGEALADAIRSTAEHHGLIPGAGPSTTVTIARWTDEVVDLLVLGDSPAAISLVDGSIHAIEDLRLHRLPGRHLFGPPPAIGSAALDRTRRLIAYERSLRNRSGGYWIAEADPSAAGHAFRTTLQRADVCSVLLVSDGIADGINHYRQPASWNAAVLIAGSGAEQLVHAVHDAEVSDANRTRWPRTKVHDDKAAAVISF